MVYQLSFVCRSGPTSAHWMEPPPVPYADLCEIGRDAADEAIDMMRRNDSPPVLTQVLKLLTERNTFDGISVGFCQRLGERLLG